VKPQRVTHVITTIQRGGAEKQLLVLVKEQIKIGWEVEVCYLKNDPELLQEFIDVGARVNTQAANQSVIKQILALRKISRGQSSIIHAHLPQSELFMAIVSNRKNFLVTRHNSEEFYPTSFRWLSRALAKFVARRAVRIITISDAVTNFNIDHKQLSTRDLYKLKRIHYGYPDKKTKPKKNLETDNLVFGTISRLVPQKDLPTLLKAFAEVSRECPAARLEIAGVGYLELELKAIADTLGISHKIEWKGKVIDIESFLFGLNAFVLSSKYEGFGLVLLEAMAANLPIIAARNSAIPEVLGKRGGLYFETGNVKSLTLEMKRVVENQSLLSLGLSPLEQLLEFSALKMAELTIETYSEVIELAS
jgi:glycosyltransferase involved in cell wall biosynthesis